MLFHSAEVCCLFCFTLAVRFFIFLVLLFDLQISLDHHDATNGAHSTTAKGSDDATLSATEMQDQMDQFTYIMLHKFLLGEDCEHIYYYIDNDQTLDDHWQREANHDAWGKYFAEDYNLCLLVVFTS
jgi:hypothetical protein